MDTTFAKTVRKTVSDRELYEKCRLYGGNARLWAKKFAALLPEVACRELYKKYKFYSIFEFAAKLAGMGRETVIEILRVARKLEDKPLLIGQLETAGWGKLKVIANVATKENEKFFAEKISKMSKSTLVTFVSELRKQNHEFVQNRTGSADLQIDFGMQLQPDGEKKQTETENSVATVDAQTPPRISVRMPLKPETELRLRKLQKKLSHKQRAPVDFNEVMETLLDTYEKFSNTTSRMVVPNSQKTAVKMSDLATHEKQAKEKVLELEQEGPSRYIPAAIKHFVSAKFSDRCAYTGCQKLPEIFHHTRRFALNPSHDPDFLMPLCKEHERLAHMGLIENEQQAPTNWFIKFFPDIHAETYPIDCTVNKFRSFPLY